MRKESLENLTLRGLRQDKQRKIVNNLTIKWIARQVLGGMVMRQMLLRATKKRKL